MTEPLGTGELLRGILSEALRDRLPSWAIELAKKERDAVTVRQFAQTFFPGLVQTRVYASHVLNAGPFTDRNDEELEGRVELRLQRQAILRAGVMRSYHLILDEVVLHRTVGGAEVMREQVIQLLSLMRQQIVTVQVLPLSAGVHTGSAAVTILELKDGDLLVHEEGLVGSVTTGSPSTVRDCVDRFDTLRSQALPMHDSARLIEARLEELNRE